MAHIKYAPRLSTLRHSETPCNTLQHTATHCNTLQHTTTHCNTLQHSATHCSTLQHTATKVFASAIPTNALGVLSGNRLFKCGVSVMSTPCFVVREHRIGTKSGGVSTRPLTRYKLGQALKCTATHCNLLQHTATHCNTLQHTAIKHDTSKDGHCAALHCTAPHWNRLQHTATHYNTLQHTATHCNMLQHTATRCNTLQQKVYHGHHTRVASYTL